MFVLSMPGTTWDVLGCPGTGVTHKHAWDNPEISMVVLGQVGHELTLRGHPRKSLDIPSIC